MGALPLISLELVLRKSPLFHDFNYARKAESYINILIFNNSYLFEFIFLFTLFLQVCYPYLPEGFENPHSIQLLYVSSSYDG